MSLPRRIQMRFGTTLLWAAANPVLAQAEPGYDTDTKDFKIGDGVTSWLGLPLANPPIFRGVFVSGSSYLNGQYVEAADGFAYVARRDIGTAVAQPISGPNWRKTTWGGAVAVPPTRQQIFDFVEAGPGFSITLTDHNTILWALDGSTPPQTGVLSDAHFQGDDAISDILFASA